MRMRVCWRGFKGSRFAEKPTASQGGQIVLLDLTQRLSNDGSSRDEDDSGRGGEFALMQSKALAQESTGAIPHVGGSDAS
jgi:hypothetical protein